MGTHGIAMYCHQILRPDHSENIGLKSILSLNSEVRNYEIYHDFMLEHAWMFTKKPLFAMQRMALLLAESPQGFEAKQAYTHSIGSSPQLCSRSKVN
jgi:hypothetical protein